MASTARHCSGSARVNALGERPSGRVAQEQNSGTPLPFKAAKKCLLLAVDVQANLFFTIRDGYIPLGRGDYDGFPRGRWAVLLGQIDLDSEDVLLNTHLDVFHRLPLLSIDSAFWLMSNYYSCSK